MPEKTYKLAVFEQGSGPPVVLLHGTLSTYRYWNQTIAKLTDKRKTYAFDLMGFGSSPKPKRATYDFEQHANSILATMDQLGLDEPVVLVGHSLGAMIAIYIAKHHPERVKRLILTSLLLSDTGSRYVQMMEMLNMPGLFKRPRVAKIGCYLFTTILRFTPEFLAVKLIKDYEPHIIEDSTRHSIVGLIKSNQQAVNYSNELTDLSSLKCTVSMFYGEKDSFAPNAAKIFEPLKKHGITVTVLPGSHQFPLEHPDVIAQAILES